MSGSLLMKVSFLEAVDTAFCDLHSKSGYFVLTVQPVV